MRLGLPLPQGKLPNDLLARYLSGLGVADPAVLVGAGVGEDVAALDVSGDEVVVAHGDPITLTSADLGRLAVLVNANDIATSGAEPRWLLTTVLLPAATTPSQALRLLAEHRRDQRRRGHHAGRRPHGDHGRRGQAGRVGHDDRHAAAGRPARQARRGGRRPRAPHQGAGDRGHGPARRRAARPPAQPGHDRRAARDVSSSAGTPEHRRRGAHRPRLRRRARPARHHRGRLGHGARGVERGLRARASPCTARPCPSTPRRSTSAGCSAPTRWASSAQGAC